MSPETATAKTLEVLRQRLDHPALRSQPQSRDAPSLAAFLSERCPADASAAPSLLLTLLRTGIEVGAHLEDNFGFFPSITWDAITVQQAHGTCTFQFSGPFSDAEATTELTQVV